MFSLKCLMTTLEEIAPLRLSQECIARGDYDNSGLLVKCHDDVKKILFSLDLTVNAVKRAVALGCDTIVTHHPAIYSPLKSLSVDGEGAEVLLAVKRNLNVISMHLNLDVAVNGIDDGLRVGLGGEKYKILDPMTEKEGYGREFDILPTTLWDIAKKVKKEFNTDKVIYYGKKTAPIKRVASFCGAGSGSACKMEEKGLLDCDLIVTSDMPHHVIKTLIERGRNILLLTHYVGEEYGFNRFYQTVKEKIKNESQCFYLDDKRFR